MFLIERLVGVGLYSLVLIIMCIFIKNTNEKYLKNILNIYLIILVVFAFLFVPPPGSDLIRINKILELYKNYSLSNIIDEMQITSAPIAYFVYWAVAKLGIKGLISAISSFIVFKNLFYIINDYSLKNKISRGNIALVIFIVMSAGFFMETISTIRDMIAYTIVCRCFYDEFYNNKSIFKHIIFYAMAFLIHQSVIAFIGIRFIYYVLYEKKNKLIKKILLILMTLIFMIIMSKYILMTVEKFNLYYNNDTYSLLWEYIKGGLELFVLFIIFLKNKKITKNNYYKYNILIAISSIALMSEYSIFVRFTFFNLFMAMPIMLETIEKAINKRGKTGLLFISLIILFLACSRCDLSSLKFFVLGG